MCSLSNNTHSHNNISTIHYSWHIILITRGDKRAHSTYICINCKDYATIAFECSNNATPFSEPTAGLGVISYGEPAPKRTLQMRDFTEKIVNGILGEIEGSHFCIEDLDRNARAIRRSICCSQNYSRIQTYCKDLTWRVIILLYLFLFSI